MAGVRELPSEIRELVEDGTLRRLDDDEFAIDALQHRQRTWMGWNIVYYTLRIDEDDDGRTMFEVVEETEYLGGDTVVYSGDPDEVESWIRQLISEKDE